MKSSRQSLADAINIIRWLEDDQNTDWKTRARREYEIAKSGDLAQRKPLEQVLHWWGKIKQKSQSSGQGERIADLFGYVGWFVMGCGFVVGAGLAGTLLYYDGTAPINVLALVMWLVMVPLVFFVLSLLLPWVHSVSALSMVNPGRWAIAYLKDKVPALDDFLFLSHSEESVDALIRYRLMLYSQQFGAAFAVAALSVLLMRASVSDLAFGWSTTLSITAEQLSTWISAFSWPWSHWAPSAVPDASFVEQSRYFRLTGNEITVPAQVLTEWWKFVAMCLLVYGVVVRSIAFFFVHWKFKKVIHQMLMHQSEVTALVDRLNSPNVDFHDEPIHSNSTRASHEQAAVDFNAFDMVFSWYGAKQALSDTGSKQIVEVTGESLQNESVDWLQGQKLAAGGRVLILVKAWEPPLLEFVDFVKAVRVAIGEQVSIAILPVATGDEKDDEVYLDTWRQSIKKIQDSGVYLL